MHAHQTGYDIVVVESSENLKRILERIPGQRYSAIGNVTCARECLETLSDSIYLVDLMLEDMDGLSLIEDIKMRKPGTPVIAVMPAESSEQLDLEEQSLRKMALQSGASALFIAPFNLGEIVGTIDRLALEHRAEAVA